MYKEFFMKDKGRKVNIDSNMYFDEKFRALTPLKPSAQALFMYLLTYPFGGKIPGLYRAGKAAMAEELGWEIDQFEKIFEQLEKAEMVKADWKNKLVFIPSMIKYNAPVSPLIVISWKKEWDLLNNCKLKQEAYKHFKSFFEKAGKTFPEKFEKSISKP